MLHTTLNKKCVLTFLMSMFLLLLTGCGANPKNFTCRELTITLSDDFVETDMTGFDAYYKSEQVLFSAVEETEEELQYAGYEIANLNGYCQELLHQNNVSEDELIKRGDYYYFTHNAIKSGAKYTYVHCILEGHNSYWNCEFVCKAKDYDNLKKQIFKWADSITIK